MNHWSFPLCPEQPDWKVDWESIVAHYAWIQELAGVPQDPVYHAEGDVLTHTEMVARALVKLPEWRELAPEERSILFAAALLHDVAKPACTRTDADGTITSRGHARIGATMVHIHLHDDGGTNAPLPLRRQIAALVRYHGLPLWFLDRPEPERLIYAASQSVRLDWVALLAEADVRGRICEDQEELLQRVELFREFCQELGCYTGPYPFGIAVSVIFAAFNVIRPIPLMMIHLLKRY